MITMCEANQKSKIHIMENPFNTQENTPKRSTLLTVLLVLTFIGSGASFLSNGYVAAAFETVIGYVEELADDDAFAALAAMLEQSVATMEKAGAGYFWLITLLYLVSVVGAVFMWKLNKSGFHLYATAQIIILFIPMLFGLTKLPGIGATIITAVFVLAYALELKIFQKSDV